MDELDVADTWWMNLPSERRVQIHDWIVGKPATPAPLPGQLELLKEGEDDECDQP